MAHHQPHGDFTNMSSSNQVFENTTTISNHNNETRSESQQHTSERTNPFDGILRTASGRETYHPDGHQSSDHTYANSSTASGTYGLFPSTEKRDTQTSVSTTAGGLATIGAAGTGAGLFSSSERHGGTDHSDDYLQNGREDQEPLEKVVTRTSSDSSFTRYGSNGQPQNRRGTKASETDGSDGSPMERTVTRPEIDHEERRNLQRALTSMSMSRQATSHSIAEPNDHQWTLPATPLI